MEQPIMNRFREVVRMEKRKFFGLLQVVKKKTPSRPNWLQARDRRMYVSIPGIAKNCGLERGDAKSVSFKIKSTARLRKTYATLLPQVKFKLSPQGLLKISP